MEKALGAYERSLERDPKRLEPLLKSAILLQRSGQSDLATKRARRAVDLHPDHAISHAIHGDLRGKRRELEAAASEYPLTTYRGEQS